MRSAKINYVAVGVFVSAMVLAMIVILIWITGRTGPTDEYVMLFDSVNDIKTGTVIRYQGYPVGQIDEIQPFQEQGRYRFRVLADIRRGWQVPKDSVARIASTGVLAGKSIDITAGQSKESLPPGAVIASGASADLFAVFNQIAGDVGDLKEHSLKPLIDKIGMMVERLGSETAQNLAELFGSVNSIAKEIDHQTPQIIGDVSQATGKINNQLLSARNVEDIQAILDQLNRASAGADQAITDVQAASQQLRDLTKRVDELVAKNSRNVDKSIANLEYILRSVAGNIDAISTNLEGTSRNMNEFSRLIRQNPGLLLSGGAPAADKGSTP